MRGEGEERGGREWLWRKTKNRPLIFPPPSSPLFPDPDREALHAETDAQEKAFDRIGDALADLKRLGGEMQTELARQAPTIERVGDRAQRARDDILHVSKSAAKGFGVKEVRGE